MDKHYRPGEKINDYTIIKIIGEGRYGIVYLAQDTDFNKVVIKQLKEGMLKKYPEKVFYEENILQKLNNPQFPKLLSTFKNNNIQGYILEYIQGNNFEDLIVRYEYEFTREEIYMIASQLISIIKILHENNIVHRDIRMPNVIVKKNKELVLIDFGLARYIDNKTHSKEMDYWYLSDFLIHLYYTSYYTDSNLDIDEKPWFEELDINQYERTFLKKLMGIDGKYNSIEEIENDLKIISNLI
jgi:serine/threonine-protein kinase